jgi:hypothetical protein
VAVGRHDAHLEPAGAHDQHGAGVVALMEQHVAAAEAADRASLLDRVAVGGLEQLQEGGDGQGCCSSPSV